MEKFLQSLKGFNGLDVLIVFLALLGIGFIVAAIHIKNENGHCNVKDWLNYFF
jgi:hypothetical protein